MKKKIFYSLFAFILLACFTSCEVLDSIANKDINLKNTTIKVPMSLVTTKADSGEDVIWNSFEGSHTLNIDDPMFSELKEYKDKKLDFKVKSVKITVIKNDPNIDGTTVKNFETSATPSVSSKFAKDYMDLSTEYTDASLNTYIQQILYSIKNGNDVIISAKGITDIDINNITNSNVYTLIIEPEITVTAYLSSIL